MEEKRKTENLKMRLIALDVDGTLVHYNHGGFGSSWDAISYALGVFNEVQKLLEKYYEQRHKDREWAKKQAALFKGGNIVDVQKHLYPIPYSLGVREFAKASKGKLIRGLLSTSIDTVAAKVAEELELDFYLCNILDKENGRFVGTLDYRVPLWEKHLVLKRFCEEKSIPLKETAYVGDHENDLSCFELVGLPIAFNPKKPEVAKKAKYVISDFRELNQILGLEVMT